MECDNCKKENDLLHRINKLGDDGIFWCEECLKVKEPELLKNIKDDSVITDIYKTVKDIENGSLH